MNNKILALLLIIAGISMFINETVFFGFFEKSLNGIERYIYTFPEVLLGIYILYYEYINKK